MSDPQALQAAYEAFKQTTYWKSNGKINKGYGVNNPGEEAQIDAYVAALASGGSPAPPVLQTEFGKNLVGMIDAGFPAGVTPPEPEPGPEPPQPTTATRRFSRFASNYSDTHAADHAERYQIIDMQGFNGPKYNADILAAGAVPLLYKDVPKLGDDGPSGAALNTNYAVEVGEVSSACKLDREWNQGYLGDVGASEFQNTWAENAIACAREGGFKGVFLDDTLWKLGGGYPSKYPTQGDWQQATREFLSVVGPKIIAADLVAVANIGSSSDTSFLPTLPDWLSFLDGYSEEGLGRANTSHEGQRDNGVRVENQLANIHTAQRLKKIYMGIIPADDDDLSMIEYGIGLFLLATDDTDSTVAIAGSADADGNHYGHEVWVEVCDRALALGAPTGAMAGSISTGYSRTFEDGKVRVNGTTGTLTIDGTSVPATSAKIG